MPFGKLMVISLFRLKIILEMKMLAFLIYSHTSTESVVIL